MGPVSKEQKEASARRAGLRFAGLATFSFLLAVGLGAFGNGPPYWELVDAEQGGRWGSSAPPTDLRLAHALLAFCERYLTSLIALCAVAFPMTRFVLTRLDRLLPRWMVGTLAIAVSLALFGGVVWAKWVLMKFAAGV